MHDVTGDAAVGRLAARQHGVVSLAQVRGAGFSRAAMRRRLDAGWWSAVDPAVVRLSGAPVTWASEVMAAVLAAGAGAMASHRTAAALWGLEGSRSGPPEVSVPRGRRFRRPGVRTHESTDLHLVSPVDRSRIPTTPAARTVLDLGGVVPPEAVHLALDSARRQELTTWDDLLDVLVSHARRGRNGVGPLRAILDEHHGEVARTDSGFERLVVTLLATHGLPKPVLQHEVDAGGRRWRIDLAYPELRLAIELDGSIHLRRDVWETDRSRQNALVLAGWMVLRFTWRDYRDHPMRLVAEVSRAIDG